MESLRQESSIDADGPVLLMRNRVLAVMVERELSKTLWTPPEKIQTLGDVVAVGPPRITRKGVAVRPQVSAGDRILIPSHIGVKVDWRGKPALILNEDEILAVVS